MPSFSASPEFDDAARLHHVAAVAQQRVGHLRVVLLDQRVRRRGVAVEIRVPTLDRCIDEALHHVGLLGHQLRTGGDDVGIAGIARIGEQQHDRLEMRRLLDGERFGAEIALLHQRLVGQERLQVERVGADLRIAVAELAGEEAPPAGPRVGADQDRLALQRGEAVVALAGMRDQHRRVLLEHRRDRDERQVLLHELDRAPAAQVEVEPARHHELHLVHLRPALADGHLQSALGVQPGGERLVVAAVFRLRQPVQAETDRILGVRRGGAGEQGQQGDKPSHGSLDSRRGTPILHNGAAIGEVAWPSRD